jgi:UDP-glucose 4-epimerase
MKILITGANGFIGGALCNYFSKKGYFVRGTVRKLSIEKSSDIEWVEISDINKVTDWSRVLEGIDVVIHTAARVHRVNENKEEALLYHNEINYEGTFHLFQSCLIAKVRKFIFLSTINVFVNARLTIDAPLTEETFAMPDEPYGISKLKAENALLEEAKKGTIEVDILRLPMLYGFLAKGNFQSLLKLIKKIPVLPFGRLNQLRSFLYIGNLLSAIERVILSNINKNDIYLLSDNDDVSTKILIKKIAKAYKISVWLIPVPLFLFKFFGVLTVRKKAISRLLGSLQVDSSKFRKVFNWNPPYTVESGLVEMMISERSEKKD